MWVLMSYTNHAVYARVREHARTTYPRRFENGHKVKPLETGGFAVEEHTDGFSLAALRTHLTVRLDGENICMQIPHNLLKAGSIQPYHFNPGTFIWSAGKYKLNVRDEMNDGHITMIFRVFNEEREKLIIYLLGYVLTPS